MRLLFATDFHGRPSAYAALVEVARDRRPDAVVLGGDLLPHVPLEEEPVATQRRFVQADLRATFAAVAALGIDLYAIHGNDDWASAVADLKALTDDRRVHYLHGQAMPLGADRWIAGLGLVPITPFYMGDFDRLDHPGWRPAIEPPALLLSDGDRLVNAPLAVLDDRPTLQDELARLATRSDPARTVYVVHTPPADCKLDLMHSGIHVGSVALRRFLDKHQPPWSLHGHIHEAPAMSGAIEDRIGATRCVNPGASVFGFRAAWVDLASADPVEHIVAEDPHA